MLFFFFFFSNNQILELTKEKPANFVNIGKKGEIFESLRTSKSVYRLVGFVASEYPMFAF